MGYRLRLCGIRDMEDEHSWMQMETFKGRDSVCACLRRLLCHCSVLSTIPLSCALLQTLLLAIELCHGTFDQKPIVLWRLAENE